MPRFVSVGECIVELFGTIKDGYRLSFAGFALDMAKSMRARLGGEWSVDLFTALGDDVYSQKIVDDIAAASVGTSHILKVPGRAVGLSLVGDFGNNGPIVTNWRSQSAARLMADDIEALTAALDGANLVFVSGGAFAILPPRARGRLLKALHRARSAGARIVLYPLEWPGLWSSDRVLGSAINSLATVADAVFTASAGERAVYADPDAEAIAARYHEWGVEEVLVRQYDKGVFVSTPAGDRWVDADTGRGSDPLSSAYLAARAEGATVDAAAARLPGRKKSV